MVYEKVMSAGEENRTRNAGGGGGWGGAQLEAGGQEGPSEMAMTE